jgi:hypothetical protein
VQLELFLQK